MPVKDYCTDELLNDFFPSFLKQSEINGVCWAVPDLASARALFYNNDILDEAGVSVPATWSELRTVCQKIQEHFKGDICPWGIDMTTDEGQAAFAYYAWGNDGGFVKDGKWSINSPENVEALSFAVDLFKNGYTNPSPAKQTRYDLQDMFAEGKLAMLIAPNQLSTYVTEKESKISMFTAEIPANDGKASSSVGIMDRIMAFRDKEDKNPARRNEAIKKFVQFFFNAENYSAWVDMEGFLPAVNSSANLLADKNPSYEAWLGVLDSCRFYPTSMSGWDDVEQGIIKAEQNALQGADVKAELDALQEAVSK